MGRCPGFFDLCSPVLKGGNAVLIVAIAGSVFLIGEYGHLNNYGSNGPNGKKMGSYY